MAKLKAHTEQALKLWIVLARAYQSIEARAAADAIRHGLTMAEFGIMEALLHKGPMKMGEIQQKLLITSGGMTYVVDQLEKKGLVERQFCKEDRRARYVALTAEGTELINEVFPQHAKNMSQVLSGLNGKEQRWATELLKKLGHSAAGNSEQ